jgi:monofunctional biosynthetic peptidoglycan transglycosylase
MRVFARIFSRLLTYVLAICLTYVVVCCLGLLLLRWVNPPVTVVQIQRTLEFRSEDLEQSRAYSFRPLDAIDDDLEHAVVASEDTRFYEHSGVDWAALGDAISEARAGRRLRGASTITQQVVKNLFMTTHRSALRKVFEIPLALVADLILSKQRILELYLNIVEWGQGVYGAEAASQHHYGRSAGRLTRNQAARLAACLPAPRSRRPSQMTAMSASIEARMDQMGF